jgi:hypothetical protein
MSTAEKILQALQIQKRPDNQYRTNSPFRSGSDSKSFSLIIHDEESGAFHDFVTEQRGSLYDLAKLLQIETPSGVHASSPDTTKRPYLDGTDYAESHGVSWSVFQSAGYSETLHMRRKALRIQTTAGPRYRFLDYRDSMTYINEKGFSPCWYKLLEGVKLAKLIKAPLIYCNGEASTVVAQHYGLPAVSIAGGGERTLTSSMLQDLQKLYTGPIIVALDCDPKGQTASYKLVKQLLDAGIHAHAVDMKLGLGGDLADWCRMYQQESLQEIMKLPALSISMELIVQRDMISAADLDNKRFAALLWTVEDILPEGCILLAGKPKSRKSWLATHIARSVAMGKKVFSRYDVSRGSVLYLDLESNQRRMQSRLRQMEINDEGQPSNLYIVNDWSRGSEGVEELDLWLTKVSDCTLVVVDILENFRAVRDRHANPYTEDYDAVKPLTALAEKHHCSILILHHTRKSKSDDAFDEISGTTGLAGGVSGMYILARIPAEEAHSELMIRGRDIESDEKRILVWSDILSHHEVMGDAETFLLSKERQEILELMKDGQHWRPSDVADAIGKSRQNTHKLLQKLKSAGSLRQDSTGRYFVAVHKTYPTGYESAPESSQSISGGTPVTPLPVYRVMDGIPLNKVESMRELAKNPQSADQFLIMAKAYSISPQQIDTLRQELLSDV